MKFNCFNFFFNHCQLVLEHLEENKTDKGVLELQYFYSKKMLSQVCENVKSILCEGLDVEALEQHLANIFNFCINKKKISRFSSFFTDFVQDLKQKPKSLEKSIEVFLLKKLNFAHPEDCIKQPLEIESVSLVVANVCLTVDQLEKMWMKVNSLPNSVEGCQEVGKLIKEHFERKHLNPLVDKVFQKLEKSSQAVIDFKKFKQALTWQYCQLTLSTRIKLCQNIIKALDKDPSDIIYLNQQTLNVNGFNVSNYKSFPALLDKLNHELKNQKPQNVPLIFKSFFTSLLFFVSQQMWNTSDLIKIFDFMNEEKVSQMLQKEHSWIWNALNEELSKVTSKFTYQWMEQTTRMMHESYESINSSHKVILRKWQSECIESEKHSIAEPSKEITSMTIFLGKVRLTTNKYLSVDKANLFWKDLESLKTKNLKAEIKGKVLKNYASFSHIAEEETLNEAFQKLALNSSNVQDLVTVMTLLLKCLDKMKEHSAAKLIEEMEEFICCHIGWEDFTPILEALPQWKQTFSELINISEKLKVSMNQLLNILQATAFQDPELIDYLDYRISDNFETHKRNLSSLHVQLSQTYEMVKLITKRETLIKNNTEMIQYLKDCESLGFLEIMGKQLTLRTRRVAMVRKMLKEHFSTNAFDTCQSEIDLIMTLLKNKEKNEELSIIVIHRLCLSLELTSANTFQDLALDFAKVDAKFSNFVDECQLILTEKCHQLYEEQYGTDLDMEAFYQDCLHQIRIFAKFLANTERETSNILLHGIVSLSNLKPDAEPSTIIQAFLTHIYSLKNLCISGKKKKILNYFCSLKDDQHKTKSFLERWMQHQLSGKENSFDILEKLENNLEHEIIPFLLTDEELFYAKIIGDEAKEIFLKEDLTMCLCQMKELAIHSIYRNTIIHYCPRDEKTMIKLLESWHFDPSFHDCSNLQNDKKNLIRFQQEFEQAVICSKNNQNDFKWLIWFQEIVLTSLNNCHMTLNSLTELLHSSTATNLTDLIEVTTSSRPYFWLNNLAIITTLDALKSFDQLSLENCFLQLNQFVNTCKQGRQILSIFVMKLKDEQHTAAMWQEILPNLLEKLPKIKNTDTLEKFIELPLSNWHQIIRHFLLAESWSFAIADQLKCLDKLLTPTITDKFLESFVFYYGKRSHQLLSKLLKNLTKFPWIDEYFKSLSAKSNKKLWNLIADEKEILEMMHKKRNQNLSAEHLLTSINNHPSSSKWGNLLDEKLLLQQIKEIHQLQEMLEKGKLKLEQVSNYAIKNCYYESQELNIVKYLSVASHAVHLVNGFYPRDTQVLAILIYARSCEAGQSCMAQISTGEGKTLIAAILSIMFALRYANKHQCVNIITSSPVLAEVNVDETQWLFDVFEVSVGNNCDLKCSYDEDICRQRYNNDVIYGDLASFQRDVLLTNFFGKDITKGRQPDAIVIDEVDSLLLDKGENVLYLSHSLPELDDLMMVFVEIWNCVHAPDVAFGTERDVAQVLKHIQMRIKSTDILLPNCVKDFTERQLLTWIRNSYRAKHLVTR